MRWRGRYRWWRTRNPEGSFEEYYVNYNLEALRRGERLGALGTQFAEPARQAYLVQRSMDALVERGLTPAHRVVDYGCGSLRLGRPLIEFLDPQCYIGLDVTTAFIELGLGSVPSDLIDAKRPWLGLITGENLARARRQQPDVIISINAVQHVPPDDLGTFFGRVTSLMGPRCRTFVTLRLAPRGWRVRPETWVHEHAQVSRALSDLGYRYEIIDEYENPRPRSSQTVQEIELLRG